MYVRLLQCMFQTYEPIWHTVRCKKCQRSLCAHTCWASRRFPRHCGWWNRIGDGVHQEDWSPPETTLCVLVISVLTCWKRTVWQTWPVNIISWCPKLWKLFWIIGKFKTLLQQTMQTKVSEEVLGIHYREYLVIGKKTLVCSFMC